MNAGTLFDIAGSMQRYAMFSQRSRTASGTSTFAGKLSTAQQYTHTYIDGGRTAPIYMGKNILCSGEREGQSYRVEYTQDSTDEDPIVRISGTASGGAFDFTCHIRDIDPSNASYAELHALTSHLYRTGEYQSQFKSVSDPLPTGMSCGDISRKQNFTQGLETFIASASQSGVYPKFSSNIYAHANELLNVYRMIAARSGIL